MEAIVQILVKADLSPHIHLAILVVSDFRCRMLKGDVATRGGLPSGKDHQCLILFEVHCFKPSLLCYLLFLSLQIWAEIKMRVL